ncbi:MAG: HAD-IIIC family phosphatase [Methyloprofundus sp.]|nr:HAD-IIIC family phosphatase [Methyloprofundus sp.]
MHKLSWLKSPPENFNTLCADLVHSESLIEDIRCLIGFALSMNQANRLYKTINKLDVFSNDQYAAEFSRVKLGVVSNSTVDLLLPALFVSALRRGVLLECVSSDFDQVFQEAFNPSSTINQASVDFILLALDYRAFPFAVNTLALATPEQTSIDSLEYLKSIVHAFSEHSGASCIVQTLIPPPYSILGNLDGQMEGMLRKEIASFNSLLSDFIKTEEHILLDTMALASNVGISHWFDERQWYLSKVAMSNDCIPLYTDRITNLLAALRGKSKKCLVMDLDNTLWGGVIGDDGLDGIVIGQGNPRGESYHALQRLCLEYKKYGVILAVCSKNDEENARQPFQEHPDMVLKESDISVFVANWEDKASNIRYIANVLNIGTDAIVFMDDNPAERELVRNRLPEVAVPELPKDSALYARTLSDANYFETIGFTQEDADKTKQYSQNSERQQSLKSSDNLDDFLSSLNMEMSVSPFDKLGRKRITQLINKTNQFNLTTQRYTESDIETFESSTDVFTMQIRLLDNFGDSGMISAVICKQTDHVWEIDTWLMSCRVIKRRVEEAVCDILFAEARAHNIQKIIGCFVATKKNSLVQAHYEQLGFHQIASAQEEQELWAQEVSEYQFKKPPISIK